MPSAAAGGRCCCWDAGLARCARWRWPPALWPPAPCRTLPRRSARPRPLLCSLMHQLKGGKRQRDERYECDVKCDTVAEFGLALPGERERGRGKRRKRATSLAAAVSQLRLSCAAPYLRHVVPAMPASPAHSSHHHRAPHAPSGPAGAVGRRGPCWLVLDRAERLAGTDLLSALLRVGEDAGLRVGPAGGAPAARARGRPASGHSRQHPCAVSCRNPQACPKLLPSMPPTPPPAG